MVAEMRARKLNKRTMMVVMIPENGKKARRQDNDGVMRKKMMRPLY